MGSATYLPTDLQRRYRQILDEAREDEARVRDHDGTNLLILPEERVRVLRRLSRATASLLVLERALSNSGRRPLELTDYGEWTWLRALDRKDLHEFVHEVRDAVIIGVMEQSSRLLDEQLRAWRTTAQEAEDPLFCAIMRGGLSEEDFVEVSRPEASPGEDTGSSAERSAHGAE
ncbi:MAG: hypothetical protein HYY04_03590 [Chloroflexi bacterium]|nr:hypothetical protein [Chloroflexota bacterium]